MIRPNVSDRNQAAMAVWGIAVGMVISLAAASHFVPYETSSQLISREFASAAQIVDKTREKSFYYGTLVLGSACGYFASMLLGRRIKRRWPLYVALIPFPMTFNAIIVHTLLNGTVNSAALFMLPVATLIIGAIIAIVPFPASSIRKTQESA